jgi:hypothetical protein
MNPRGTAPIQETLGQLAPGGLEPARRGVAFDRSERAIVAGLLVLISIGYFYAAISRSIADHFWMDEVLAVSAARQPALSDVWTAIWSGTDFSPPTFHVLLHGIVGIFGHADSRLIWRLPSILAVYGAAVCTYLLLVKSQLSRWVAVLGFGIVLSFSLFSYAIQVRQYGLLTLGLAIALLLWSGMDDTPGQKVRAFFLWLVLAACLCLHFYGLIEVAVIGVAESIYWISRRRFRLSVWTALLLTAPVEMALYPIAAHLAIFNAGDNVASGYYAAPTKARFFDAVLEVIGGGAFGTMVLLAALLMMGIAYLRDRSGRSVPAAAAPVAATRAVRLSRLGIVVIALCLLPFITFAFSLLVTKSFNARYMVGAALLPAIAAPYLLNRSPVRRTVAIVLIPVLVVILIQRARAPDYIGEALTVLRKAAPPLPIVVGEGLLYVELMEAADPSTRSRLVYLLRQQGSVSPDPTNENLVTRMAAFHPDYQVSAPREFLKDNAAFYELYRPNGSTDTTTPALIEKGILGPPLDAENGIMLFRAVPAAEIQPGMAG